LPAAQTRSADLHLHSDQHRIFRPALHQTRPGLRPDQTRPGLHSDQTRPDQTRPDRPAPDQTTDQTRPDQTRPDLTSNHLRSVSALHQTRTDQTRPIQTTSVTRLPTPTRLYSAIAQAKGQRASQTLGSYLTACTIYCVLPGSAPQSTVRYVHLQYR
jgi:hypothetical protein